MKEINIMLAIVLAFGIAIPIALWNAYAMTVLWSWYAPASFGPLPMRVALGIALLATLLTSKAPRKDDPPFADRITSGMVGPGVLLGFGWLMLFFV